MPKNKAGKTFKDHFQMSHYDKMHAPTEAATPFDSAEQEGDGQEGDGQEPSAVVAAHGPAEEVNVKHSHGKHHVHSKHSDGHQHHSDHASAGEAHEHAAALASEPQGEADDFEAPSLD